jgi:hypothetical protein
MGIRLVILTEVIMLTIMIIVERVRDYRKKLNIPGTKAIANTPTAPADPLPHPLPTDQSDT